MARLASQERGLYVPSPSSIIHLLQQHVQDAGETGSILDPCCGTGEAAHLLAKLMGKKWRAFGVELDIQRAKAAEMYLGKGNIINAPFQDVHIDGKADLLFLNPPYDDDHFENERMEFQFLRWSSKNLNHNGVLVYIVKDYFVDGGKYADKTAKFLAELNYESVKES